MNLAKHLNRTFFYVKIFKKQSHFIGLNENSDSIDIGGRLSNFLSEYENKVPKENFTQKFPQSLLGLFFDMLLKIIIPLMLFSFIIIFIGWLFKNLYIDFLSELADFVLESGMVLIFISMFARNKMFFKIGESVSEGSLLRKSLYLDLIRCKREDLLFCYEEIKLLYKNIMVFENSVTLKKLLKISLGLYLAFQLAQVESLSSIYFQTPLLEDLLTFIRAIDLTTLPKGVKLLLIFFALLYMKLFMDLFNKYLARSAVKAAIDTLREALNTKK